MTTYSMVDQEYTMTNSGSNSYLNAQTVYTVPTGKLAKIQFDSVHVSQSADNTFNSHNFVMYSQGTNIIRKHMTGYYEDTTGDVSSLHFYDMNNFSRIVNNNGSTSAQYQVNTSAQSQDWSRNGAIKTNLDTNFAAKNFSTTLGTDASFTLGTSYWYMEAGEVLKLSAVNLMQTTVSGSVYYNVRCMVFLEDS